MELQAIAPRSVVRFQPPEHVTIVGTFHVGVDRFQAPPERIGLPHTVEPAFANREDAYELGAVGHLSEFEMRRGRFKLGKSVDEPCVGCEKSVVASGAGNRGYVE